MEFVLGVKPVYNNRLTQSVMSKIPSQGKSGDPIHRMVKYPSKIWYRSWMPFIEAYSRAGEVILDPMCGSGTVGIASLLLERKAVLSDASNHAVFLSRAALAPIILDQLEELFLKVTNEIKSEILSLYDTNCGECGIVGVAERVTVSNVYTCPSCKHNVVLTQSKTGMRSKYQCENCNEALNIAKHKVKSLLKERRKPVSVRLRCANCGFVEKAVGNQDIKKWQLNVSRKWEDYKDIWIPKARLQHMRSYPRVGGWPGIEPGALISELFSIRNLLALAILRNELFNQPESTERQVLLLAFSEILNICSMRQHVGGGSYNTFYIIPSVGYEKNVFTAFQRKVRAIINGKKLLQDMVEINHQNLAVLLGDARSNQLESESIDYVCVDPPYGGYIPYFELNMFQSAWLGMEEQYDDEIMIPMDSEKDQGVQKWGAMMRLVFSEIERVLRSRRLLTIAFQSRFPQMWDELGRIVEASGFEFHSVVDVESGETFHRNLGHAANPTRGFVTFQKMK
ncbi:MAG: DNA methyltransferase [Candidatus Thorarchaeota archaeon]